MTLVPYTITAIERDDTTAVSTGKQIVVGAACSMFDSNMDAVNLYDDEAGSNGSTGKVTGSNGQVTVYVSPGVYTLQVNGQQSAISISEKSKEVVARLNLLESYNGIDEVNNRGAWQASTAYAVNDIWQHTDNTWYLVLSAYTSDSSDIEVDVVSGNVSVYQNNDTQLTPLSFGAVGDGVTLDTVAVQNAIYTLYGPAVETVVLNLGNDDTAVFLVDDTILNTNLKAVIIKGAGTIKRADGMILNTDEDYTNFIPLMRIAGAPYVNISGTWRIDGNRDGQTYPATHNFMGRGSKPWRHNGDIEICPSTDNTTRSKHIKVDFGGFENTYFNGLVLWQCEDVKITKTSFKNITWNGISGAGCTDVNITANNYFYRCGASEVFTSNNQQGDRAGIQFREFAIDFTSVTEGIPCIVTGEFSAGGINKNMSVCNNIFVECGVESVYMRAAFNVHVNNNNSRDCGYQRLDAEGRFYPAHIWLEAGQYTALNNTISQSQVRAGDMRPDGMRITSLVGDATALFPANGKHKCQVNGNTICSDYDTTTGLSLGLFNYGIRCNGDGNYDNNTIDGTDDYAFWVINGDSFAGETIIRDFSADSCTFSNIDTGAHGISGYIRINKFGEVVGDVENISARGCKVDNKSLPVISINNNLLSNAKINIAHGIGDIFSRYSETAPVTMAAAGKYQVDHNLGEVPKLVMPIMRCLSNDGGWQTGDECPANNLQNNGSISTGTAGDGIFIGYDKNQVTMIVGAASNPIRVLNRAGGLEGLVRNIALEKWELFARCFV